MRGEVLGWDEETDRHLVLYDDGEHERLLVSQERITLHSPQRGGAAQIAPGLPVGESCQACGHARGAISPAHGHVSVCRPVDWQIAVLHNSCWCLAVILTLMVLTSEV